MQALSLKARHEVPFIYPVELDSRSRLFTPNTRSGLEDNDRKIEVLLKTAQRNFEEALRKDPDYTPAYVNLACVFDLLGNYEAAIGKINELKSQQSLLPNAFTIRAIAYLHNEQIEKANRDFAEAQRLNGFGTTHNFTLAQKGLTFVQNASEVVEWFEKNTPTQPFVSTKPTLGAFKAISATPTVKLAFNPTTTLSGIVTTSELSLESKSNAKVLKISKILSIEALTVGSSKVNVKEVLGLPIKENPTYWLYDGLIVNFDGDIVSELLQYQLKE
ncbi:tetratricopeptide repeat protein [Runella sp.]|uniref:tetratricopeptide repeat protein n=1 Tax=Runella sp. TaxID=1960881 RepID=UPI00301AB20C